LVSDQACIISQGKTAFDESMLHHRMNLIGQIPCAAIGSNSR
jgi:hypothetical protein